MGFRSFLDVAKRLRLGAAPPRPDYVLGFSWGARSRVFAIGELAPDRVRRRLFRGH